VIAGRRPIGFVVVALVVAAQLLTPAPARAESAATFYLGDTWTLDSDVRLVEPGGTDLVFQDVPWDSRSFESPQYWGLRYVYWLRKSPRWGVAGELIHAKMFAELDATVQVEGTRAGAPVSGPERLGDTFRNLSFSHGHNMLLASGERRWFPGGERGVGAGRIQPRIGFGIGAALTHVEVNTASSTTDEYQFGGPAAQLLGGAGVDLSKHLALFFEYKLTYADITADLTGGERLDVSPWAHHLTIGLSVVFGRANPAATARQDQGS